MRSPTSFPLGCLSLLSLACLAPAQCLVTPVERVSLPGCDAGVLASTWWDPDGGGPIQPRLVVGGEFHLAGSVDAHHIVAFEPSSGVWTPLGIGMNSRVRALLGLPDGRLIATGDFSLAGGVPCARIAAWNGSTWTPLGSGLLGNGHCLTRLPTGEIVVGGTFSDAGGLRAGHIACWQGTSWRTFDRGFSGDVHAVLCTSQGVLLAGGSFTAANQLPVARIAAWTGSAWAPIGTGFDGTVRALAELPNGMWVAAGEFDRAGTAAVGHIARWNGYSWLDFDHGMDRGVESLAVAPDGTLFAGGNFTVASGSPVGRLARWSGLQWQPQGAGCDGTVRTLTALPGGELYAGGHFQYAGESHARHLCHWTAGQWQAVADGLPGTVVAQTVAADGALIVATAHDRGTVLTSRVLRRRGTTTEQLGPTITGAVYALATLPNGDLVAGGNFTSIGGASTFYIARWVGGTWQAMGAGMSPQWSGDDTAVYALATLADGSLVAAGRFAVRHASGAVVAVHLAMWNGTGWSTMGNAGDTVLALLPLPDGQLVASGAFTWVGNTTTGPVARWDGTTWHRLGYGPRGVVSHLGLAHGGVVAALLSPDDADHRLQRWDGSAWAPMPGWNGAEVMALHTLPDGDLLATTANAVGTGPASGLLARWTGGGWSPLGPVLDGPAVTIAAQPDGSIALGGGFQHIDGMVTDGWVRLASTCPALLQSFGPTCSRATGPITIRADRLAWLGDAIATTTDGVGAGDLVLGILGLRRQALALPSLIPGGGLGCELLCTTEMVLMAQVADGRARVRFAMVDNPAFRGIRFRHQVAVFDPAGASVHTSAGLEFTLGRF